MNLFLIFFGKLVIYISRLLNLGNGSTWPGHIALSINKNFIKDLLKTNDHRLKTILVAGTNGKTTTAKLIQTILGKSGKKVFQNEGGANLLNGIASSMLLRSSIL
ncbi:MAG: Mur ligase family protein, partial [Candidatus Levybacteria bacterium]|nr:Mur ligase family protein [Candidatus Levybacteria bacterium]